MTATSVLCLPVAPLNASLARTLPFLATPPRRPCSCAASRGASPPFSLRATAEERSAEEAAVVSSAGLDRRRTLGQIREELYRAVDGIDRGIFGAPSEKKSEILALVLLLESRNPTPDPTDHLDKVAGCWRLIYSTITILGSKRTKLGLRDLITLGDFLQTIDVAQGKAINEIKFNVRGLQMLSGQLTIVASFKVASKARVNIELETSGISPNQLMNLFQKNYDILLAIFNPEGWLEISYVDEFLRIGRDDKGNIFILERFNQIGA